MYRDETTGLKHVGNRGVLGVFAPGSGRLSGLSDIGRFHLLLAPVPTGTDKE